MIPIILVESANFINTILLPQTTTWLIYFLLIGLLIFMMYNGSLQTIGFLSEVFGPIILIVLFFFHCPYFKRILCREYSAYIL